MCSLNNMLLNLTRQEYPTANPRSFRFPYTDGQRDFSSFAGIRPEAKTNSVDIAAADKGSSWSEETKHGEKENNSLAKKSSSEDGDAEGEHDAKDGRNFTETFVAVIAQSILSVPSKRMTLSSIYNYIAKNYPHFDKEKGPGWRNSVRHNLSSNDCFVKASRAENGKGHYWMIHPKDLPEFSKGNFRRRRKPRRPKCSHSLMFRESAAFLLHSAYQSVHSSPAYPYPQLGSHHDVTHFVPRFGADRSLAQAFRSRVGLLSPPSHVSHRTPALSYPTTSLRFEPSGAVRPCHGFTGPVHYSCACHR